MKRRRRSIVTATMLYSFFILFHHRTRTANVYNEWLGLAWYNVVLTPRINSTQGRIQGFNFCLFLITVTAEGGAAVTSPIPPPCSASYTFHHPPCTHAEPSHTVWWTTQFFRAGGKSKWLTCKNVTYRLVWQWTPFWPSADGAGMHPLILSHPSGWPLVCLSVRR